jgi:hypothetical protein
VLVPAADLVDPLYPADPGDTVDVPGGVAVADPALSAGPVGVCWLCWKAAGAADSDEAAMVSVGVDQVDCAESCSSAHIKAAAGDCGWAGVAIF